MDKGIPQTSLCSLIFEENEFSHLLGLVQLLLPLVFSRNEVLSTVTQYFYFAWAGSTSVMLLVTISLELCVTVLVPNSGYA